jgi:hypothetical protein
LHVGDGDETNLKTFLGLLELTRDGFEGRGLRLDGILRREDVEVGLGDAKD